MEERCQHYLCTPDTIAFIRKNGVEQGVFIDTFFDVHNAWLRWRYNPNGKFTWMLADGDTDKAAIFKSLGITSMAMLLQEKHFLTKFTFFRHEYKGAYVDEVRCGNRYFWICTVVTQNDEIPLGAPCESPFVICSTLQFGETTDALTHKELLPKPYVYKSDDE